MKTLNFVQFVCVSVDHTSPMMAVHHALIACFDLQSGTNN